MRIGTPYENSPLSLEFARRARKLHGALEAVVDCGLRLTCSQFWGALRPVVGRIGETRRAARGPGGYDFSRDSSAASRATRNQSADLATAAGAE